MAKQGYMNGSDMLLGFGDPVKCFGHCSEHSVSCSSEVKDRAVKPLLTAAITSGLYKSKGVTGLSISVSSSGLVFYNEAEFGYKDLFAIWKSGQPVKVSLFERNETGGSTSLKIYLKADFIISSLEMNTPAQDDSTYSVTLEMSGVPDVIDETQLTAVAAASGN